MMGAQARIRYPSFAFAKITSSRTSIFTSRLIFSRRDAASADNSARILSISFFSSFSFKCFARLSQRPLSLHSFQNKEDTSIEGLFWANHCVNHFAINSHKTFLKYLCPYWINKELDICTQKLSKGFCLIAIGQTM